MLHLSHEILYVIVAFLAGSLIGVITGFCLFGGWLMGWIFPASVPEYLATNDTLAANGKQRSKLLEELPFAWSDKYDFTRDEIGNITYKRKDMQ
jgi:polyferredoxin